MPIYEQSVNVRKMSPVWWYATWRILARYVGIAAGLTACRIAEIGNLWYKFSPKGYIPLRDFFYKIWRGVGSPRSAQSRKISPLWLLKRGLRAPEIVKIGNFSHKFAKKGYTPLSNFYKIWLGGGSPRYAHSRQMLPLWLYKCGLAARKIAKIGKFCYIFAPKGQSP